MEYFCFQYEVADCPLYFSHQKIEQILFERQKMCPARDAKTWKMIKSNWEIKYKYSSNHIRPIYLS